MSNPKTTTVSGVIQQIRQQWRDGPTNPAPQEPARHQALMPAPPELFVSLPKKGAAEQFTELEQRSLGKTDVGRWIPKVLRRLFRRQGGFNKDILAVTRLLNKQQAETGKRLDEIVAYLRAENGWFDSVVLGIEGLQRTLQNRLDNQISFERRLLAVDSKVVELRSELLQREGDLQERLNQVSVAMDNLATSLREGLEQRKSSEADVYRKLADLSPLANVTDALQANLTTLEQARIALTDKLEAQHTRLDSLSETLGATGEGLVSEARARESAEIRIAAEHSRIDALSHAFEALRQALSSEAAARESLGVQLDDDRKRWNSADPLRETISAVGVAHERLQLQLQETKAALGSVNHTLTTLEEQHIAETSYLKRELHLHSSTLATLTTSPQPGKGKARAAQPTAGGNDISKREFDSFYLAFENQFRGSRRDIKERVKVYLPLLKKAEAGKRQRPIIDLGCGRGEFLELLRDEKLIAEGIDLNEFMVTECAGRKLRVTKADALDHITGLPSETAGAITAFHVIEHLPFASLLRLCAESLRVLRPHGLLILETPNPDNVQVGSNRFYSDPTHLRPLPHALTRFVMATAGFKKIELLPLHPDANAVALADKATPLEKVSYGLFFGAQDYAVIGRK